MNEAKAKPEHDDRRESYTKNTKVVSTTADLQTFSMDVRDGFDRLIQTVRKTGVGKKRFLFITWKDNTQKKIKMDYPRKWLLKFSDHFIIVRSPVGGVHFHMMAILKANKQVVFQKGIHICVKCIGLKERSFCAPDFPPPPKAELSDAQKSARAARAKILRVKREKDYDADINRVYDYMLSNLYENLNPWYFDDFYNKLG